VSPRDSTSICQKKARKGKGDRGEKTIFLPDCSRAKRETRRWGGRDGEGETEHPCKAELKGKKEDRRLKRKKTSSIQTASGRTQQGAGRKILCMQGGGSLKEKGNLQNKKTRRPGRKGKKELRETERGTLGSRPKSKKTRKIVLKNAKTLRKNKGGKGGDLHHSKGGGVQQKEKTLNQFSSVLRRRYRGEGETGKGGVN